MINWFSDLHSKLTISHIHHIEYITHVYDFIESSYNGSSKSRRLSIRNNEAKTRAAKPTAAMTIYASDPPNRLYCTDAATREVVAAGPMLPMSEKVVWAAACVRPRADGEGEAFVMNIYMQPDLVSRDIDSKR
jgi:hypothetical protein